MTAPRAIAAYGLVVIAALLAPVAILGTWAQRHVVSTPGYVDTVGPLSGDVRVQRAVTDAVTNEVIAAVPTKALLASLPPALTGTGDATEALARSLIRSAVTEVVGGPAFHALWVQANRGAQTLVLAALRANAAGEAELAIDLHPVAEAVRLQLVANGFTVLKNVRFDAAGRQTTVSVPTGDLGRAGHWWRVFESVTRWLGPVVLLLAAAALVITGHRRRLLLVEALALLLALGACALVTARGHAAFVDRLNGVAAADAARAVGDVFADSLGHWLRGLAVVASVVTVAASAALAFPTRAIRLPE